MMSSGGPDLYFSHMDIRAFAKNGACMSDKKTAIVTGASGGIGSGLVEAFLKVGYNVVATARNTTQSLAAPPSLVLLDGDIGKQETAWRAVAPRRTRPWLAVALKRRRLQRRVGFDGRELRLTGPARFRIFAMRGAKERRRGIQSRAMRFYYFGYAYAYRFSFTGERAGETCAAQMI
jgi:hypothetical protein